ncbi:DNA helicase [Tanacetum coccineum]
MYQLHERFNRYSLLFKGGRLFQQYVIGVYCCIEQNCTDFYRTHQSDIRKDYMSGIYDVIYRGDHIDKIEHAEETDQHISVELPDPELDPDEYKVVSEMMVHGPCSLANANAVWAAPLKLWNTYWRKMSDDIPIITSKTLRIQNLHINDPELQGFILYELKITLNSYSKTPKDFGLHALSARLLEELRNMELMEEKSYNKVELAKEINKNSYFLRSWRDRENFLWKVLISAMQSEGKIVLVVASSGIASLLLPASRTTHSRFNLPLELIDKSICNIKKNTHVGILLAETDIIIWDESPMNDCHCFKTLDITLRDIMGVPDKLFGGKSVVLGGDFHQTLPVKKGTSKPEIIAASIAESELWRHFKVCTLTENMRLQQPGISDDERELSSSFSSWLIDVGDGKIRTPDPKNSQSASWISIPEICCIPNDEDGVSKLINFIYDEHTLQRPNAQDLLHRMPYTSRQRERIWKCQYDSESYQKTGYRESQWRCDRSSTLGRHGAQLQQKRIRLNGKACYHRQLLQSFEVRRFTAFYESRNTLLSKPRYSRP